MSVTITPANPARPDFVGVVAGVDLRQPVNAADAATFASVGAFALNAGSNDAAVVATLQPGSYTAQVSGVAGGTGTALIEIYAVAAP